MLSRYGRVFQPPATLAQEADPSLLLELLGPRDQPVTQRTQEKNRLSQVGRAGALVRSQWLEAGLSGHTGGRTRIKRVLYLASLSVSRSKVGLGACYDRLRQRGNLVAATTTVTPTRSPRRFAPRDDRLGTHDRGGQRRRRVRMASTAERTRCRLPFSKETTHGRLHHRHD